MERDATRNRSLDGIRGLATILILVLHHSYLNSGWLALELFFVLSGYLITTILRRSREDEFFWREFWIKRFTRIFPPLALLLVTVKLIFNVPLVHIFGYFLSLGDVLEYFVPFGPLGPLWSLAIEEHFYIIWPFAVRLLSRQTLLYILVGVVLAEPLLRALVCIFNPDWRIYYYLTPFRLDGLSLGCILALLLESEEGTRQVFKWSGWCQVSVCLLWFGLRFSLGSRFTRPEASFTYNSLAYSIISLGSFGVVGYVLTHPKSKIFSFLSWRWLTFTGTISYGLYCYQLVVRELTVNAFHLSFRRAIWIDAPVSFLVAWLSYKFYERPIASWGRRKANELHLLSDMRKARSIA